MKTWFRIPTFLALAFCAAGLFAQETKQDPKKGCCGGDEPNYHAMFCGSEKCDNAKCKDACAKAGAELKAVCAKIQELAKKEWGDKACECCDKSETKPCAKCTEFGKTVVVPAVKARLTDHLKDLSKEFKHTVKSADGKSSEVACTFLKGDTCGPCADEIAGDCFAKLKEAKAKK